MWDPTFEFDDISTVFTNYQNAAWPNGPEHECPRTCTSEYFKKCSTTPREKTKECFAEGREKNAIHVSESLFLARIYNLVGVERESRVH